MVAKVGKRVCVPFVVHRRDTHTHTLLEAKVAPHGSIFCTTVWGPSYINILSQSPAAGSVLMLCCHRNRVDGAMRCQASGSL